jgi:hypothetical protein
MPMSQLPDPNKPFDMQFENGQSAHAVRVVANARAAVVCRLLGFKEPSPAIFVSGGASKMSRKDRKHTKEIIEGIAQFAEEHKAVIIDGGTESGIMKMVGDTRGKLGYRFPLIGVSPLGKVSYPGYENPNQEAFLEDSHSHFVLVDGDEWGVESKMIVALTQAIAGKDKKPSVGILINGGKVAMQEVYLASTRRQKMPMIVVEGSGRAADEISTAFRTGKADHTLLQAILSGGDIVLVGTVEGPAAIRLNLMQKFESHQPKE